MSLWQVFVVGRLLLQLSLKTFTIQIALEDDHGSHLIDQRGAFFAANAAALQEESEEFASEARILLAVKLYEMGKLSTGLAAQLAGMSREAFFFDLGRHVLSPFGERIEELEEDFAHARRASHRQ